MPIAQLSDVISALPGVAGVPDGDLLVLRDRAEVAVARYLRIRHDAGSSPSLDSSSRTVYLDGPRPDDVRVLNLWRALGLPVTAVSAVDEDLVGDRAYSSAVSSSDYELVDGVTLEILPAASHGWASTRRSVRVACTAGYSTTDPPEDLLDAILLTVRAAWEEQAGLAGQGVDPDTDALRVRVRVPAVARDLLSDMRCLADLAG